MPAKVSVCAPTSWPLRVSGLTTRKVRRAGASATDSTRGGRIPERQERVGLSGGRRPPRASDPLAPRRRLVSPRGKLRTTGQRGCVEAMSWPCKQITRTKPGERGREFEHPVDRYGIVELKPETCRLSIAYEGSPHEEVRIDAPYRPHTPPPFASVSGEWVNIPLVEGEMLYLQITDEGARADFLNALEDSGCARVDMGKREPPQRR